jgi:hypothetical protein
MVGSTALEKGGGKVDEQGMLFEYTIKFLLLASFLELVLYRLVSRLGMHLSKLAAKYEAVRLLFKGLSSIGFALLNFVSLLVFLAISVLLFNKMKESPAGRYDAWLIPIMALLLILTVAFLVFPPAMLGSIIYNVVSIAVLIILALEYFHTHGRGIQRATIVCYLLGVFGWLYYQTVSTAYGFLGLVSVPPLVHEINRAGEAMMVLASILLLWAYGGISLKTKNLRQRRRVVLFVSIGAAVFFALLFLDYFLVQYDKATAESIRKAGEGIGWIFQMGMGYTFYLPFACYVAGLFCWAYAVLKQITMGRLAGYGLGLMFMAGYALQLSHLTLMVMLGLMLLNLDKRRASLPINQTVGERPLAGSAGPMVGEQLS